MAMVVLPTVGLFKALDVWMTKEDRERLRERLAEIWFNAAKSTPLIFIQLPLRVLKSLLDRIYGPKVISFKAFIRVAVSSVAIFIPTLGLVGIFSGTPFSFEQPPWHGFDESFRFIEKAFTKAETEAKTPEHRARIEDWHKQIAAYQTPGFRVLHTVIACGVTLLLIAFFAYVSLVISRKLLRDLTTAKTGTTLLALLFLDALFSLLVFLSVLSVVMMTSLPLASLAAFFIGALFREGLLAFGFVVVIFCISLECFLAPTWVKISSFVATLPALSVLMVAFLTFVLFPFRKHVHKAITQTLDRALQYEKGPVSFIIALAVFFEALVALAKL